jgi:hypothetical protein
MAFDLYVGTFTRYITGDWENVGQRAARELGVDYAIIRDNVTEEAPPPPEVVREAVLDWVGQLNQGLAKHLPAPLAWDEADEVGYLTDRPDWHGYSALLLTAAHVDHPEVPKPTTVPEEWGEDEAYKLSTGEGADTSFPTLLLADLWLPGEFEFLFGVEDLGGNTRSVASTKALLDELRALNDRSFKGTAEQLASWRQNLPDKDAPMDDLAKTALAMMLGLCEEAVRRQLPMMPDY